jgi:hypothetical protein
MRFSIHMARPRHEQIPPFVLAFFEQLPVVGTPEAPRVRALLDAGVQHVIFIVLPFAAAPRRRLA